MLFCVCKQNQYMKNIFLSFAFVLASLTLFTNCTQSSGTKTGDTTKVKATATAEPADTTSMVRNYPPIDKAQYDSLMKRMGHGDSTGKWPLKNAPYPLPGAILPYK